MVLSTGQVEENTCVEGCTWAQMPPPEPLVIIPSWLSSLCSLLSWAAHQFVGLCLVRHAPINFGGTAGQEAHGQGEVSAGQRVDRSALPLLIGAGWNEHLPLGI